MKIIIFYTVIPDIGEMDSPNSKVFGKIEHSNAIAVVLDANSFNSGVWCVDVKGSGTMHCVPGSIRRIKTLYCASKPTDIRTTGKNDRIIVDTNPTCCFSINFGVG